MTAKEIVSYISERDFAVIATNSSDYPESACIQFGNSGLTLIFDTSNKSRKFKNLQKDNRVSFVIGWENERTVQYEGVATLLEGKEREEYRDIYFAKSEYARQWEVCRTFVLFRNRGSCFVQSDPYPMLFRFVERSTVQIRLILQPGFSPGRDLRPDRNL